MEIGVIIIGDEILSGKRQDRHFARSVEILAQRGLSISWVNYCRMTRRHSYRYFLVRLKRVPWCLVLGVLAQPQTITRGKALHLRFNFRWSFILRRKEKLRSSLVRMHTLIGLRWGCFLKDLESFLTFSIAFQGLVSIDTIFFPDFLQWHGI